MKRRIRLLIGLISCVVLCIFGLYRIFTETLTSGALFTAILFAVCGFIGAIGNLVELRK